MYPCHWVTSGGVQRHSRLVSIGVRNHLSPSIQNDRWQSDNYPAKAEISPVGRIPAPYIVKNPHETSSLAIMVSLCDNLVCICLNMAAVVTKGSFASQH